MAALSAPLQTSGPGIHLMANILVVEDPLISKLVRTVLQKHGYQVSFAEAAEARELLGSPESPMTILVTNSPGPFLEFAERVPLLYLTSAPDSWLLSQFNSCRVVVKPFVPQDLVQAVVALTHPV